MPDDKNQTDPKTMTAAAPDADVQKIVEMVLQSKPMVEMQQTLAQFKALLAELEQEQPEDDGCQQGGKCDLLEPADDDDGKDDKKGKGKGKGDDNKEQRNLNEPPPVKFDANGTNCCIPTTDDNKEKKTKMSRETDEVLKYKREFESYKATTEKVLKENAKKFQRLKAEKVLAELQANDHIDFGDKENTERELDLMSNLSDPAFDTHVQRIKTNYKRRTPDSAGVTEALKYARTGAAPVGAQSNEDAIRVAEYWSKNPGMSYEEAVAKSLGK